MALVPFLYIIYEVLVSLADARYPEDDRGLIVRALTGGPAAPGGPFSVPVTWAGLGLIVLPQLARAAQDHYGALQEARSSARKRPPGASPPAARRTKLREREPW